MLRNEKGFTYPLTFSILLLAAIVLTMHIEFYLAEVRFLQESENLLKQEYYLFSSKKRVEAILLSEDEALYSGIFTFSDGDIQYETAKLSDTLYMSTFYLRLGDINGAVAYGYFDKGEGKMIRWIERN